MTQRPADSQDALREYKRGFIGCWLAATGIFGTSARQSTLKAANGGAARL
jgi:hypothetical protein